MVVTLHSGPIITAGNLMDGSPGTPQITNPSAGPNMDYHGDSLLDVRYFPIAKDYTDRHGVIPAYWVSPTILTVNGVPTTKATNNIVAAANPASGVAMTLAGAAAGITKNIPILPLGTSTVVTAATVLDFGFELVNVSSGSKNVTVSDSSFYQVGQPLIIGEASTTTTPLITYVTGITSATVITIANAAGRSNSSAPCGSGNQWSFIDNIPALSTYAYPYLMAGPGLFFNPREAISRCVSVTGVASGSGGTVTISGWDIYWQPMTQTITLAAGANTVNSTKAFKAIKSVVPNFTDTHTVAVGTADIIGMPLRSDLFEQTMLFDASALLTASTGYVAADATSPATSTTGDPRGTYALQTAADSTRRTVIYQNLSFKQAVKSSPVGYINMFGVTPV